MWGCSSAGRATALQAEGRRFDPVLLHQTIYIGVGMSHKETIEKAYGSIPKEVELNFSLDWIPTSRGIKYYWIRLVRFITR